MVYAQFYHDSTGWNGTDFSGPVQLVECLGSDGVFILDARNKQSIQIQDAKERAMMLNRNLNFGIKGFKIMRSPRSFLDGKPVTGMIHLE